MGAEASGLVIFWKYTTLNLRILLHTEMCLFGVNDSFPANKLREGLLSLQTSLVLSE